MNKIETHALDLDSTPDTLELFVEELPHDQHVNRMISTCCYGTASTAGCGGTCASSFSTFSSACG